MKAFRLQDVLAWALAFIVIYVILAISFPHAINVGMETEMPKSTILAISALIAAVGSTLFIWKTGKWKGEEAIK